MGEKSVETKPMSEYYLRNIKNAALCICEWADNKTCELYEGKAVNYNDVVKLAAFYGAIKQLAENYKIEVKEV